MPLSRRDWIEENSPIKCGSCEYTNLERVHEVNFCGSEPTRYEIGDPVPEHWVLIEKGGELCFAVHTRCQDCGRLFSPGIGYVKNGRIDRIELLYL